ncbi:hypothetical protein AVEN_455-1 [Araneus ventricosus]|uniref:Uncharacterized protein n=1 Tax=Araneus ventricosus TaxID=182803 RepID=A0A4Y2TEB8_ARAVE|nr:hypothetical protein AVEN_455-1 [Araneus ventricosus]
MPPKLSDPFSFCASDDFRFLPPLMEWMAPQIGYGQLNFSSLSTPCWIPPGMSRPKVNSKSESMVSHPGVWRQRRCLKLGFKTHSSGCQNEF